MRNHRLESRVRENRTHGSEGGEGERSFLPLSVGGRSWFPGQARDDEYSYGHQFPPDRPLG